MPDGSINVKITADTSGFTAGINQVKSNVDQLQSGASDLAQTLAQLSQSAEESQQQLGNLAERLGRTEESSRNAESGIARVHESFGKLRESAMRIAEIFGVGFGIREAVEGLKSLAEMGEHAANVGESLGLTAVQYERLAGAMRLAGGNSESLTRLLIMLERSAKEALDNVGGPQADAFRTLEISTQQLKEGLVDLPRLLYAVADAYEKFGRSGEKAREFSSIAGGARAVQNIAPLFRGGSAGLQAREQESESRTGLDAQNLKKLEETAHAINQLKESFLGLGATIYKAFHEPIDDGIKAIERLVEDGKKIDDLTTKFDHLGGAIAGAWAGFKLGGLPGAAIGGALGGTVGASALTSEIDKRLQVDIDNFHKIEKGWDWLKAHAAQLGQNFRNLGVDLGLVEPSASPPFGGEGMRSREHESAVQQNTKDGKPSEEKKEENKPIIEPGPSTEKIKKDTAERIKALDEEVKLSEARYALQETQANGDRQKIALIEDQKLADAKAVLEKKRRIYDEEIALLRRRHVSEADIEQIAPKSERTAIDVESVNLDTQAQRAKNEAANAAARDQIKQLEIARRGADEQEQLQLRLLERRTSLGELTVGAASAAEAQIVQAHAARVAQILAQEAQQAQGQKQLLEEVRDRAIEVEQQQAVKLAEIQEKSYEERVKRAKEIDKELASSLADAIMGVAEHKETWGQAIVKIFEQQEKKLLEKSLQKLFDQSGLGESLGGLGELLGFGGSSSPEDALKLATSANTQATGLNTDALNRLITALSQQIGTPGTGTGTATEKTGTGTGTAVDVGQPGSGKGGTVTTDQVAAVAAKYGFSAAFGNAVVDIESSHGANLGHGKYGGNILQVGEKERESLGVHGMGTPEEQLDYGFRLLAQRRKELSAQLGREATEDETYLAHNQGPGGAHALLTHPNEPAGQVIREATHGREGAANISSNFHGDPNDLSKVFTDRVFARLHRGENRFGGTAESGALASADAEHKQAATEHKQAAKELKDAAGALKNVPEGNSPYAQAVRADIAKNGPMAGSAAAATTSETDIPALADGGTVTSTGLALVHAGETVLPPDLASVAATAPIPAASASAPIPGAGATAPIPVDIRAIAGGVVARPASTSGGGLPVSPAAPPSAAIGEPAAATAELPPPGYATAPLPPAHAAPVLGGSPFNAAGVAGAIGTPSGPAPATPAANPPFGGEGMLSREHESAVQENTKAVEENTRAQQPGTTQPGPQLASAGATDAADAPKQSNGLLGQLLGLLPLVAGLIAITSKNKTERAVGFGVGGLGLLSLLNKGGDIIPGFAEGGPVDETGLALVHAGEYVVPADQAQGGVFGDFKEYLSRSWQHLKAAPSDIGQAFVDTAQGYLGQEGKLLSGDMSRGDLAGFAMQHLAGGAPAESLSAGIRLADLGRMSNRGFLKAAEEMLPPNFRFDPDAPPTVGIELREGLVSELNELNEKYRLQGMVNIADPEAIGVPMPGAFAAASPSALALRGEDAHQLWLPPIWSNTDKLFSKLQRATQTGFNASADPRSILTHEYGHLLDFELGGWPTNRARGYSEGAEVPQDPLLQALKERGVSEAALGRGPSDYAGTHPDEWLPEAFSAIRYPGRLPPTPSQNLLNDYLEHQFQRGPYPEDMGNLWRLTPDPDKVMQLHLPLAAQPAGVRRALEDWGITPENPDWGPDVLGQDIWDALINTQDGPGDTARNFFESGIDALRTRDQALIRLALPSVPGLATGGTVTHSGLAQIHAGETIVPAQVVPIQTIQAGARQSQPGPGPSGQTTQTPWVSIIGLLAGLMVLPKLLGGFGGGKGQAGGDKGQAGGDTATIANTQATQQNTQAVQQNTEAKQPQGSTTSPAEVGGTGAPGTGVDVGLLRAAASGSLGKDIPQYAKGGPVDRTGLAMLHAGEYVIPSADDGDITGAERPEDVFQQTPDQNNYEILQNDDANENAARQALRRAKPSASYNNDTPTTGYNNAGRFEVGQEYYNPSDFHKQYGGGTGTYGTQDNPVTSPSLSGRKSAGRTISEQLGLTSMAAGGIVSADDGDITGGADSVEMVTNPLTGNAVPRYGSDGADWAMANLAEWKKGPSGSLAQRAWSSVKDAGSWAWSFNPFNAKQFSAQSFSSNSVLGGMNFEQVQSLTPMTTFSVLDVVGGGGPAGAAKTTMASLGGGEPGASGGTMAGWLASLWSGNTSAQAAETQQFDTGSWSLEPGDVIPSSARGNLVVPGEIAPVATQGAASPVLPSTNRGFGKGWELWAALLALLMLLSGGKGKKTGPGTGTSDVGETAQNPLPDAEGAALGEQLVADDLTAPDVMATGGASASAGAVIASAAGGLQVHETSLPQRIKSGVRDLAAKGKVGLFRTGRLTSAMRGAPVADGKNGQLAVVHPGEMILPAPETSQVLSAMSSEAGAIVPSAARGTVVALPEQQTVSSLGFQPITLEAANPSGNLGGLTQILALIMALQKLMGGLGGLFGGSGGNNSPTGSGGQGGLLGGILGLPQKLLGGLFGGQTSGGGANSGVEGMVKAADQAAPALQGLTSSTTGASSGLTGFAGMLGGLLGGGGGGGGGGLGGIFGFIPKLLGGLFALEGGGVIPSAAGGMMVGAGGSVADGKGGRLIIAHPQEMVLPARQARGLSNLLANFEPSAPSAGGLGRILSMRMMTPTIPHFAQGAWEIDRDMVGMLHQGEQIVPSSYAEGLRAAGGGGPSTSGPSITYGDTHVHLSAIDSRSGAQFLMAHSDTIAKSMFRAHRNNSRFTPGG